MIPRHSIQESIKVFLAGPKKILLIMGDSGAGKSSLCEWIQQHYGSDRSVSYFNLGKVTNSNQCFVPYNESFHHPSNIIIFDDYGDNKQFVNLISTQNLIQWQGKIIITCHPYHLLNFEDYTHYFAPFKGSKVQSYLIQQIEIPPLSIDETNQFLNLLSTDTNKISTFLALDIIKEMKFYPLLLKIAYSTYVRMSGLNPREISTFHEEILSDWFSYNRNRFQEIDQTTDLKQKYRKLCYALASTMVTQKTVTIDYQPQSDLFPDDHQVWSTYFNKILSNSSWLLQALPFHYIKLKKLQFWSASMLHYLAHRHEISANTDKAETHLESKFQKNEEFSVGNKDLLKNKATLQFLAGHVQASSNFKKYLIHIVLASRSNANLATASSNAMTILNAAKLSFCNKDLSRINIPDSILDHGLFERTNFSGANMERVKMRNSFINYTNFDSTIMKNMDFGKLPIIDIHTGKIVSVVMSNHSEYLATLSNSYVGTKEGFAVWNANDMTLLHIVEEQHPVIGIAFDYHSDNLFYATKTGELIELDSPSCELFQAYNTGLSQLFKMLMVRSQEHTIFALLGIKNNAVGLFFYDYQFNRLDEVDIGKFCEASEETTSSLHWQLQSSHDGKKIILSYAANSFCTISNVIYLIDVNKRKLINKIKDPKLQECTAVAFSQDDRLLIASSYADILYFEMESGTRVSYHSDSKQCSQILAIEPSPYDNILAITDTQGNIHLWDITEKIITYTFQVTSRITHLAFIRHHGESVLCIGDVDGTIQFRNTYQLQQSPHDNLMHSPAVGYSTLTEKIWAGGADGKLRIWDMLQRWLLFTFDAHESDIHTLLILDTEQKCITSGADGIICIWNLIDYSLILKFKASDHEINALCVSIDRRSLFSAGYDTVIRNWNIENGNLNYESITPTNNSTDQLRLSINTLTISHNGSYLMVGHDSGYQSMLDLTSETFVFVEKVMDDSISSVSYSTESGCIAIGGYDNTIRCYSHNNENITIMPHFGEITFLKFVRNGKYMLSASHDGMIIIWKQGEWRIINTIQGNSSGIISAYISEDESILVISRWSGCIETWSFDINHPRLLSSVGHTLVGNNLNIENAELSPFNKKLLTQISKEDDGIAVYRSAAIKLHKTSLNSISENEINLVQNEMLENVKKIYHDHHRIHPAVRWNRNHPEVLYSNFFLNAAVDKSIRYEWDTENRNWDIAYLTGFYRKTNQFVRLALRHGATLRGNEGGVVTAVSISDPRLYSLNYFIRHGLSLREHQDHAVTSAVLTNNIAALTLLKKQGISLNKKDVFQLAMNKGHLEAIQFLEEEKLAFQYYEFESLGKVPPVHAAAALGYSEIVKYYILDKKVYVDIRDHHQSTPLHMAITHLYHQIAFFLLEQGADPTLRNDKKASSFEIAVESNNLALTSHFLENPQLNLLMRQPEPNFGLSLMSISIVKGCYETANLLYSNGFTIHGFFMDAEIIACVFARNYTLLCKQLITLHPEHFQLDSEIMKILYYVKYISQKGVDVVKNEALIFLVSLIKNKKYSDPENNTTFLYHCASIGNIEVVRKVFDRDIMNFQNKLGVTALMIASSLGYEDVVEFLLEQGADPNLAEYNELNRAIHGATLSGQYRIVKTLSEYKADVNAQDKSGFTPLILAAQYGFKKIFLYLLDTAHANPLLGTYQLKTIPLFAACLSNQFSIARNLCDRNLGLNILGVKKFSPLHACVEGNSYRIANYLIDVMHFPIEAAMDGNITPLVRASELDRLALFKSLYSRKANIDIKISDIENIFSTVLVAQHKAVAQYISTLKEHNNKLVKVAELRLSALSALTQTSSSLFLSSTIESCLRTFSTLCAINYKNDAFIPLLKKFIQVLSSLNQIRRAMPFMQYLSRIEMMSNNSEASQQNPYQFFTPSRSNSRLNIVSSQSSAAAIPTAQLK